jgi:hypothetical protein
VEREQDHERERKSLRRIGVGNTVSVLARGLGLESRKIIVYEEL